jgi:PQQ-dependent dehydrogenase (methanol/ethanol family)
MTRRLTLIHCLVAAAVGACTGSNQATRADSAGAAKATGTAASVAGTRIAAPRTTPAGEWQMPAGDYSSSRFSDLAQITTANAANLRASWTFSTGVLRGHEGQPLVVNNTMYVVTPYPNVSYAIDLTQAGQPLKWKFRPENSQAATGQACCDVVNRGAAYADGRIFYNLLDGHTVAVDAATGKQLWRTKMADLARGETMTMAPIVVKGKVLVGSSGGEMGVRGWLAAIDASTGKEVWRGFNTGSDRDMKVGPRFKAFYAQDNAKGLGLTSWPGDTWKQGGGAVWGWLSYDPELNLVYYGTSNPGPWNESVRKGDNKWSCAIMARDADHPCPSRRSRSPRTTCGTMIPSTRTSWSTCR